MKILAPPQINSLDELLDVVLHPDKFAEHLKQMQDMRDAIAKDLIGYETKAKVDDSLAQAKSQSDSMMAQAQAISRTAHQEAIAVAKKRDQFTHDQEAWSASTLKDQAALKARQDDLAVYAEGLKAKELDLNRREMQVQEQDAALARLQTKLTGETEKMERRKAVLSAIV